MEKKRKAFIVEVLRCSACGAPIEVPNLCVYCGNRLYLEGMDLDKRLRDLEMEEVIFCRLQEMAMSVGLEVRFAMEPREDLCFAYFAKSAGADKSAWRKVGSLGYANDDGVKYGLMAMTVNKAAEHTHWLRIRSFGLPDNTKLYECSNDQVDFLDASLEIDDIRSQRRNSVWLMLVQMLDNVDPTAGGKLKKIARDYERSLGDGEDEQGDTSKIICADIALAIKPYQKWLGERPDYEFGDDPERIDEMEELVKRLLVRVGPLLSSLTKMETESLGIAAVGLELRAELTEFSTWIEKIREKHWGSERQARELKNRLTKIQGLNDRILQILERHA
jgi:hypothetical protein